MAVTRQLFLCGGLCSLALGIVGAFLPVLPTTPFILLAGYCFSRSSPRWHQWISASPWFGPILSDWETRHGVRRSVKALAALLVLTAVFGSVYLRGFTSPVTLLIGFVALIGLGVIWKLPTVQQTAARQEQAPLPAPCTVTVNGITVNSAE